MTTRRPPPDDVDATALLQWSAVDPVTQRAGRPVADALRASALPSAWVSELDDSAVHDDDIDDASAPTTIMQLPPDMVGHRVEAHDATAERDVVEFHRWRAGPQGAPQAAPPPQGAHGIDVGWLDAERSNGRRAAIPLDQPPATDDGDAVLMDEVTLGGLALGTPERLRATLDEAMGALMAAQAVADGGNVPDGVVQQLGKAVELLQVAQELSEEL